MSSEDLEEQVRQAEQAVGTMSINEALYGGPRGPGLTALMQKLTDNVTSLSTTVADLAKTVTKVSDDVNGGDGLRVAIRDLRRETNELREEVQQAKSVVWRCIQFLVVVGIFTVLVDSRIAYSVLFGVQK